MNVFRTLTPSHHLGHRDFFSTKRASPVFNKQTPVQQKNSIHCVEIHRDSDYLLLFCVCVCVFFLIPTYPLHDLKRLDCFCFDFYCPPPSIRNDVLELAGKIHLNDIATRRGGERTSRCQPPLPADVYDCLSSFPVPQPKEEKTFSKQRVRHWRATYYTAKLEARCFYKQETTQATSFPDPGSNVHHS